jgi:methylated-DNA-protein-cysteine methyltransferase-like protein
MPDRDPHQRIVAAIAALPRGRVAAYGQVAARAGLPGRARLVARVLANSPTASRLPWHRVVRSDGRPGLPQGSPGYEEQLRRLKRERVGVVNGRVEKGYFVGERDLDAALWAPR